MRPRRLYATKDDRFYYLIKGKKKFIKVPQGMSQKQLQKINITNIIGEQPARRLKRKTKKVVPVYGKKIATKKEIEKNEQKPPPPPSGPGLPVYIFRPQQKVTLDIPEPIVKIETKVKPEPVKTEPVKTETPVFTPVFTPIKVDESLNMIGRTRELLESEMKKDQESINKKLKNPKLKFGAQKSSFPESASEQISPVSRLASIITDEYNKSREFIKQSRLPKGREAQDLPIPTDKEVVKRLNIINNKRDNKLLEQLIQYEYVEPTELQFIINNEPTQLDVWRRLAYNNVGVDKEYEGKDSLQNAMRRKMNEDLKSIGQQLGEGKDNGLFNDEIEKIMKKRIKNYVPVVARDKVDELLEYVSPNDKFFSAVINTDPSGSSGRHWRCIVIDNRDDFPAAEYFDPLAEDFKPEETLLAVMRKIAKKMNPEKYFKFKSSLIRRQDISKSNCGYHVMKFIEDRHNGIPYSEASGWDDYMKMRQKGKGYEAPDASQDGEGDLKSYEKMIKKKFNSYI